MQSEFIAALREPSLPHPRFLSSSTEERAARGFNVYRNNVVVGLVDTLAATYPVVQAVVGEPFFRAMGRQFCHQHPPKTPVLALYGDGLARFIAGFAPAAQLPYLADLARLEWQRTVALQAADDLPLAQDDIAGLVHDPAALLQSRWRLHASLSQVDSEFSVVSLWAAHQLPSTQATEVALANLDWKQAESALVLRQGLDVMVLRLAAAESVFVRLLGAGYSLGDAVQEAHDTSEHFDLTLMFALLLRSGALASYTLGD